MITKNHRSVKNKLGNYEALFLICLETFVWSEEETHLLIATYKEWQMLFLNEKKSKASAWEKVVEEMTKIRLRKKLKGIPLKKCISKMESLKRHYKLIKDSKGMSSNKTISWKFFDVSIVSIMVYSIPVK